MVAKAKKKSKILEFVEDNFDGIGKTIVTGVVGFVLSTTVKWVNLAINDHKAIYKNSHQLHLMQVFQNKQSLKIIDIENHLNIPDKETDSLNIDTSNH